MAKHANDLQASPWAAITDHLRRPSLVLLLLSALTVVLYCGTLSFGFIWDDHPQIVNNPLIRSWAAVPRVFVSDLWFHTGRPQVYYRPLFVTWSTLNYAVFGLNPWGWHLGAILLHVLAAGVIYLLARKLRLDHWTAALAAVIFALHPIHIETVAWISAASDTMVTVFCMLAFIAFLNSRDPQERSKAAWRVLSIFVFACGLFTKEMAVTFAGVIAVYVWLYPPQGRKARFWPRVRESIIVALPYGIVTIGYLGLRKIALHNVAKFDSQHGLMDVVVTLPAVLFQYLRLLVVPVGLTGLYYTPYVTIFEIRNFYLPVLALVLLVGLLWYWAIRMGDRLVAFAGLWTIITLAPVLYLPIFTNGASVRDRYAYLPSVGFVILMAKAIRLFPAVQKVGAGAVQAVTAAVLAIAFIAGCLLQQVYWANEVLLFYRGHSLYPENTDATIGYAIQLSRGGDNKRAITLLQQAVKERPGNSAAHLFLAEAYIRAGRNNEGRKALEMSLELLPEHEQSEVGMADLAGFYARLGDYGHALDLCSRVLEKEPDLYSALYNCGNINFMLGRNSEAEKLLRHAVQVAPGQAPSNYFLGRVLLQAGRATEAERYLRRATELVPNGYEYHYWLGQAIEMRGDIFAARQEYLQTLKLNPGSEEAKARLAAIQPAR